MARPLPPTPLLVARPLVDELFFAASLWKHIKYFNSKTVFQASKNILQRVVDDALRKKR